jgi:hypothetical protein
MHAKWNAQQPDNVNVQIKLATKVNSQIKLGKLNA